MHMECIEEHVAPIFSQRPVYHFFEYNSLQPRWFFLFFSFARLYFFIVRIVSFTTYALMNMLHWRRNRFVYLLFVLENKIQMCTCVRACVCVLLSNVSHITNHLTFISSFIFRFSSSHWSASVM